MGDDGDVRSVSGPVTAADLGISAHRIRRLADAGEFVRLSRGVYVSAADHRQAAADPARAHALTVAGYLRLSPGLVASHWSAARIHALAMLPGDEHPVTLTRPSTSPGSSTGRACLVRKAALPAGHVTEVYGVRVTTVARTVADLARTTAFRDAVVAADSAINTLKTTKRAVADVLATCPRWPGIMAARQVLAFANGLTESPLESAARVLFAERGLPAPELQVSLSSPVDGSFLGRVDFLWPRLATIAEVDGDLKYEDPGRARQQLRRDQRLRDAAWEVVHLTWRDVFHDPDLSIARIRTAFERGVTRDISTAWTSASRVPQGREVSR